MEIENVRVFEFADKNEFNSFVLALKKLNVGQSFTVNRIPGNYRLAISTIQIYGGVKFCTRKECDKYRVGRVE